jgi:hypothetical protein
MKDMAMKCPQANRLLSPYLDGAVTGAEMHSLREHLDECAACLSEYTSLRQTQQLLMSVGRPQVPADLGLKLRLAISREAAETRRPYEGLRVRLENAFNAFMVPATAGLVCAVLIFGLVAAILATPGQLQANTTQDVPLMLNTGPELQESAFSSMSTINAESLVIEAYVDRNGRVQDYKILSDPGASQDLLPQVKRMLIFTTFRPAMSMGHPISSRAVLSFSRISVQG